MLSWPGATLLALGAAGLAAELVLDVRAAPWASVASGWAMAVLLLAYASGVFARPRVRPGESSRPVGRGS
jgi:membrane protein implicated in regulation of membrane protease activity